MPFGNKLNSFNELHSLRSCNSVNSFNLFPNCTQSRLIRLYNQMGAEYGLRITMENGVIKLFNMWPYCTVKAIFALLRRKLFFCSPPLSLSFPRNTRELVFFYVEKKSSSFIINIIDSSQE